MSRMGPETSTGLPILHSLELPVVRKLLASLKGPRLGVPRGLRHAGPAWIGRRPKRDLRILCKLSVSLQAPHLGDSRGLRHAIQA